MLLHIHQSEKLEFSAEGCHEEGNRMFCCGPLVDYLSTFANFSTILVVHVEFNALF